jgi:hypothetical protein
LFERSILASLLQQNNIYGSFVVQKEGCHKKKLAFWGNTQSIRAKAKLQQVFTHQPPGDVCLRRDPLFASVLSVVTG